MNDKPKVPIPVWAMAELVEDVVAAAMNTGFICAGHKLEDPESQLAASRCDAAAEKLCNAIDLLYEGFSHEDK